MSAIIEAAATTELGKHNDVLTLGGETYYSWVVLRFPPWPGMGFMTKLVHPSIVKAHGATWRIDSAAYIAPDQLALSAANGSLPFKLPPDFIAGRGKPWAILVQWTHTAETSGTPLNEAGLGPIIKGIIVTGLAGLGLLTYRVFTQVKNVIGGDGKSGGNGGGVMSVPKLLDQTVFNPGFAIIAVVIVALILRAKRK